MIRLRLLGMLELVSAEGVPFDDLLNKPKRLALLAYMACSRGNAMHRRASLAALFWPELDEVHARDNLSQAIYHLRRALAVGQSSAVLARGSEEIGVDPAALWCDVTAFQQALGEGKHREALELYRGPLLNGFHTDGAPGFEDWLGRERHRLAHLASESARTVADDLDKHAQCEAAIIYARRALEIDPFDERAFRQHVSLLDKMGDRGGALRAFNQFEAAFRKEFDALPSAETQELLRHIRARTSVDSNAFADIEVPSTRAVATELDHGSQPSASRPHPHRRRSRFAVTAGTAIVALLAALAVFSRYRNLAGLTAHHGDRKQLLIVTDFRVVGADTALGWVISDALVSKLRESRRFSFVPPARVAAVLHDMQQSLGQPLTLPLAEQVAARLPNVTGVLDGLVTVKDSTYVIAIRVVTADSGNTALPLHGTAMGSAVLLKTVDDLASDLRRHLGERLEHVTPTSPTLPPSALRITTKSLDALRKYAASIRMNRSGTPQQTLELVRESIALDSTCAMCWRALFHTLLNANFPRSSKDSALRMAFRYRGNLSELENYAVTADYFINGPGHDRDRGIHAYERILQVVDDGSYGARVNLAVTVAARREFARAESLILGKIAMDSGDALAWSFLPRMQFNAGKEREARATVRAIQQRFGSLPARFAAQLVTQLLYQDVYQTAQLDRYAARIDSNSTITDIVSHSWSMQRRADLALLQGKLKEYLERLAQTRRLDAARGLPESGLEDSLGLSAVDASWPERRQRAVDRLDAIVKSDFYGRLRPSERRYLQIASLYARAGRPDRATSILRHYTHEVTDTALRRDAEPAEQHVRAECALVEGRTADAIRLFKLADRASDGAVNDCTICLFFDLARAFDRAGQSDSALTNYERYITTPYFDRMFYPYDPVNLPWALQRLGELYEQRGDSAKAAQYHTRFATLWVNADASLRPHVRRSRLRAAALSHAT